MTNEQHIKSMNTNQLAKFFYEVFECSLCPVDNFTCKSPDRYMHCVKNIEKWLEKEILE